jgi:hypothetical protein
MKTRIQRLLSGAVSIPDSINGLIVVKIGYKAIYDKSSLSGVTPCRMDRHWGAHGSTPRSRS